MRSENQPRIRRTRSEALVLPCRVAITLVLATLAACSSGSFDSDVGKENILPTARIQVLNGLTSNIFREGSEVLLTGKDSEDSDGPIIVWQWNQTAGPAVLLVERNSSTVSFTTPDVNASTTMTFELTVTDTKEATDRASIDVTVLPAQDANEFLSLDVRSGKSTTGTFDHFKAVVALADGAIVGSTPAPFTLSATAYLVYPPRSNVTADCPINLAEFLGGIPDMTNTGCLVRVLEDLTPADLPNGETGIEGVWPANTPVPAIQTIDDQINAWWNPRYSLEIPRLDVADFNQQFIDAGNRDDILDAFNVHKARILISFELIAPQNQSDATLILTAVDNDVTLVRILSTDVLTNGSTDAVFENPGTGLPTVATVPLESILASIAGRESALTAEVYYRTVDPNNTRTTFNAWLQQAGFASDANGALLPDAEAGNREFAHAIYVNNFDLGFGRDMYTRTDEFGNVYAFVDNYATLEGAIRGLDPIVTVVMEYSPLNDPADTGAEKFVKFFTYVDDGANNGVRVGSMNFDGRGERFTPGNCIECHRGSAPPGVADLNFDAAGCGDETDAACYTWPMEDRNLVNIANGNLNATFVSWDLDSFLFTDNDPAITRAPVRFDGTTVADDLLSEFGDFSRSAQEPQLKKLNQAAYSTFNNDQTAASRTLVEYWYNGVDANGLLVGQFDDSTAPPGWQNGEVVATPTMQDPGATSVNPDTAETVYQNVVAQHCRMCHLNAAAEPFRFANYPQFIAQEDLIIRAVFERGLMPGARLTADRFWTEADGAAPRALANEFGFESILVDQGPQPFAEMHFTGPMEAPGDVIIEPPRSSIIRLSGDASAFADSFMWSVSYSPPPELAANPDVANFQPTVVGATAAEISFSAEQPGDYAIGLTINEAGGAPVPANPAQVMIANFSPQPRTLSLTVAEGASRSVTVRDELNLLCPSPDCAEVFGDPPATVNVDVGSWNPAHGSISLDNAVDGTITVTATKPGPISTAVPYSVTDIDSESAFESIAVTILALTSPVAAVDMRSMDAQTTVDPARELAIDVLTNDTVDPAAAPLVVDSFTQPSNGSATQNGDNLVYSPDLGFLGTDAFTYVAADSNPTGSRTSDPATVTVTVSPTAEFNPDVIGAFGNFGCLGCHDTFAPSWSLHAEVVLRTDTPDQARNSLILTFPGSGTHFVFIPTWNETNADYVTVLRWIEEGSEDN